MSTSTSTDFSFVVGQIFEDVESVKSALVNYNKQYDTEFTVNTNNKKAMVIKCKHGRKRNHDGTGKRPNQHYSYLGCNASINIYKNKDGNLKVTKVDLQHNHEIRRNQVIIDEGDEELILTLADANARPSQIKRVLKEKNKKDVSSRKIQNLIKKLSSSQCMDKLSFEEFLQDIDDKGGVVEWTCDPDGSIKALFLITKSMKAALLSSNPPVMQMDTTFNIDRAQYKLTAFCYLNPLTNKTEVAALALVSTESEENFDFVLSCFHTVYPKDDTIFLVDKDFTCIDSIRRTFSRATVLLCIFHVLKYMRTLFATAVVRVEKKEVMMQKFKAVIYARDDDVFKTANDEFITEISGIEVRVGQSYRDLVEYYNKNWFSSKEMWVKYLRKKLPLLGDHTTNRIERMFWSLKKSILDTFNSLPKTIESVMHLIKFADQRIEERSQLNTMRSLKIYSSDSFINELNETASLALNDRGCIIFNQTLKIFKIREKSLQLHADGVLEHFPDKNGVKVGEKVYQTTLTECNCTYRVEHQAPCRHIIFARLSNEEMEIFDIALFNERYHRVISLGVPEENDNTTTETNTIEEEVLSDPEDVDESDDFRVLSDHEKFKQVMPILVKIGNLISCHSTNDFYQYLDDLQELEKSIRRGQRYLHRKDKDQSDHDQNDENVNAEDLLTTEDNDPLVQSSIIAGTSSSREETNPGDLVQSSTDAGTSPSSQENNLNTPAEQSSVINTVSAPSRFQALSFKEMLKAKGRPKKKNKQVKFRRTAVDGKEKKGQEKRGKEKKGGNVGRKGGKQKANAFKALVQAESQGVTGSGEEGNVDEMSVDEMATELLDLPFLHAGWADNEHLRLNSTTIDIDVPYVSHLRDVQFTDL